MKSIRILLIEDDQVLNAQLAEFFTREGYIIEQCYRGDEGLEISSRNQHQLIILDVMLPGLDGYISRANEIWRSQEGEGMSEPEWIAIFNVNDAESYVVVERFFSNRRVALGPDQIVSIRVMGR